MLGKVIGNKGAVRELLAFDKTILQSMSKLRLNFANPFVCIKGTGNFTNNSIIKQVSEHIDTWKSSIYILIDAPLWHDRLYVVGVDRGLWDVEVGRKAYTMTNKLDYYCAKKKVDEHRKMKCKYYIIAQEKEYMIPWIMEKKLDCNERMRVEKITRYGRNEAEYIYSINCTMYDDYKNKEEYRPISSPFNCKKTNDIYDIIDKSGYITDYTKCHLYRRVEIYKRDKNKRIAKEYDCSQQIEELKREMTIVKNMLGEYLISSENPNYLTARVVCNTMVSLKKYIKDLIEHEFSSKESKIAYLEEATRMIEECKKEIGGK